MARVAVAVLLAACLLVLALCLGCAGQGGTQGTLGNEVGITVGQNGTGNVTQVAYPYPS